MRLTGARISLAALVSVLLGGAPAAAFAAQPTPNASGAPAGPPAVKGTPICKATDRNAVEISGLVLSNDVLYALNDSTSSAARQKVFKLNPATCAVIGSPIGYPAQPRDPEDLAMDAQGTIWIGDIGDNGANRPTVAVWKLANDKITGPYRMAYPDGKKYDAEALLIGSDGLPIIVTKLEGLVFTPTGPLQENSTSGVPMKQVGKVTLPKTNTDNPFSAPGRTTVTGAATSPDRKKVALRTYADAFEWAVPDGDIVKAITTGKPKVTPLPNEPWGEAIVYGSDGKFWTMSDVEQFENTTKIKPELLSYSPNTEDASAPTPAAQVQQPSTGKGKAWWSDLVSSTTRLYMLIGSIGVFGLLLVLLGVLGIRRARRRRDEEEEEELRGGGRGRRGDDGYDDGYYDQRGGGYGYQEPAYGYHDQGHVYGAPHAGGNVYGGGPQGGGNVYGGGPQGGGNVYGGGPQGGGNVYGGGPQGGGNVYGGGPQGGGNVYGAPQGGGGGGNAYGSPQPQYGYEEPYYQPPPPQQQPPYGEQPGYGYPDYPDQGYNQQYR